MAPLGIQFMPRVAGKAVLLLTVCALAACGSISKKDSIDYRSASEAPTLELPPDLTAPTENDRFSVSDVSPKGSATYSAYNAERSADKGSAAALPAVAPAGRAAAVDTAGGPAMRVERAGSQRWLVVGASPEALWPQVREFWIELGFVLDVDQPAIGIMETDWAEDRAKIPQDFIRETLGKVIDNVFSTPERDKFRTRLEAGRDPGQTEIFISHRGMMEIYPDEGRDRTIWQPRPADPELEAEMLRRLMVKLGATESGAKAAAEVAAAPERARIESADGVSRLVVSESFERAWRRVGLALDRTGFTVEDRDRSQGIYFVRYVDPEADTIKGKGFLSKLLFWRSDDKKPEPGNQYRVRVAADGERSTIAVLTREGGDDRGETAKRILSVLHEQLR